MTRWRKSSYSDANGECVELAQWRKSSRSNPSGECVEVSSLGAVRDSKNPSGPVIAVEGSAFAAFLSAAKADRWQSQP